MPNLNTLETFRTKEELLNYFEVIGQSITEEEIETLKQSYTNAEENGSALSLQQLGNVAGGVFICCTEVKKGSIPGSATNFTYHTFKFLGEMNSRDENPLKTLTNDEVAKMRTSPDYIAIYSNPILEDSESKAHSCLFVPIKFPPGEPTTLIRGDAMLKIYPLLKKVSESFEVNQLTKEWEKKQLVQLNLRLKSFAMLYNDAHPEKQGLPIAIEGLDPEVHCLIQ